MATQLIKQESKLTIAYRWAQVREFVDKAGKFERCKLACQVMVGFDLQALRKELCITPGRPAAGKLPHDVVIKTPSVSWADIVAKEAGISDETARRWMAMADGVKSKFKKMQGTDRLRALVNTPVQAWTAEDTKMISAAVHKITDGKTQLEFMWDIGVAKKPQGSGAKGGALGGGRKKLSAEEQVAARRQMAAEDWELAEKLLIADPIAFTLLPDEAINAQIATLEQAVKARFKWLGQPVKTRNAEVIEEFFKRA